MKVFCSAARSANKEFSDNYKKIVEILEKQNLSVYDDTRVLDGLDVFMLTYKEKKQVYKDMIKEMDKADFSVFEASWPSTLHTGHKITLCIWKTKPVIGLYKEGKGHEPILFRGIENKKVMWVEYNEENLEEKLLEAVEKAKKILDLRLNLFIPGSLMTYLDWATKDVGVNKSEYIRMLIEKEIKKK